MNRSIRSEPETVCLQEYLPYIPIDVQNISFIDPPNLSEKSLALHKYYLQKADHYTSNEYKEKEEVRTTKKVRKE